MSGESPKQSNPSGERGNFDLQADYLLGQQRKISGELFVSGAVNRIIGGNKRRAGAVVDVSGFNQLDALFVPSLRALKTGDGKQRELSLAALGLGNGIGYFILATVDPFDMVYPYSDVVNDDAEQVMRGAQELLQLQADGILPGLTADLLSIANPYTGITLTKPSDGLSSPPEQQ